MDLAEPRALTDDELIRRPDALAAERGDDAAAAWRIYSDELRARVVAQRVQEVLRRRYVVLAPAALVLVLDVVILFVVR